MALQEDISHDIQQQKVGQTLRVIIDREDEDYYIGRTQWDSPEVDPEVLITKENPLAIGEFAQVRITEALPFELIATSIWSQTFGGRLHLWKIALFSKVFLIFYNVFLKFVVYLSGLKKFQVLEQTIFIHMFN